MTKCVKDYDVVIIGAGPSGTVAASLLKQKGYSVLIIEKAVFPRFSIGESLLPQSMAFFEKAGLLNAIDKGEFQYKDGAAFCRGDEYEAFDFCDKISDGWGTTFQVPRAKFDHILASEVMNAGVDIRWNNTVSAFHYQDAQVTLSVIDDQGMEYQQTARFVLDASGFARVLPGLLDLEAPSNFESRVSLFTHIEDNIVDETFDRNKILITVHNEYPEVWFWLIPFSDGRSSVGVVAKSAILDTIEGDNKQKLQTLISQAGMLAKVLEHADFDSQIGCKAGYSSNVKQLYGDGYALLGNAGEFLDPVFSSGVTIAVKSADLAVQTLDKQLQGLQVDWQQEFAAPLKQGVDTFRVFVEAWYTGELQQVIFAADKDRNIKRMISAILAGYAWDLTNPLVKNTRKLATLAQLCKG